MNDVAAVLESTLREMGARFETLRDDAHLEDDLGLESLMRVELATKLQKRCHKPVVDHIDNLQTIGDVLHFLRSA
jgi:acyl carrier protein